MPVDLAVHAQAAGGGEGFDRRQVTDPGAGPGRDRRGDRMFRRVLDRAGQRQQLLLFDCIYGCFVRLNGRPQLGEPACNCG